MARPQESNVTVQGNITGDKIAMGIDAAGFAHIMGLLTDLYADPELAVLREYSTNARDAHIEAGNSAPVEVDLPTPLSPFLTIRDYGIGLSHDDIRNIYSQYGASTKRETNEQTGSLGIGCKSALTYASQFTLVGTKEGRRVQVTIGRDETGAGSMTVVEDRGIDAPNGVEVKVPAKSQHDFDSKAAEFFRFWPAGSVLVNGKAPEPINGLKLDDKLWVRNSGSQSRIVMGNIPYPTSFDQHSTGLAYGHSLVAFVDIGDVVHTPSREALQDVPKTAATQRAIEARVQALVVAAVQRDLDAAESNYEALTTMEAWRSAFPRIVQPSSFNYKGLTMPDSIRPTSGHGEFVTTTRGSYRLGASSTSRAISVSGLKNVVWVEGWDLAKFTASHKRKLNQYCEARNIECQTYVLTHTMPDRTWLDNAVVIPWADVNAIKLPRTGAAPGSSGRPTGSYDAYVDGKRANEDAASYAARGTIQAAEIKTKYPVFYLHGNLYEARAYCEILDEAHKHYTLVAMGANRLDKFRRDFPSAVRVKDEAQNLYDAWAKKITPADQEALAMTSIYGCKDALKSIDPKRVDDPKLKLAAKAARRNVERLVKVNAEFRRHGAKTVTQDYKSPLDSYPLCSRGISSNREHCYIYLNAAYAASLTKKS